MYESKSDDETRMQFYVLLMVEPSVEEKVIMHFRSLLDRGFELEFVDFDGSESLNELIGLYPFDEAVIDGDLFLQTNKGKKSGYGVAWELLQLDPEIRIMLMGECLMEENKTRSHLKDNVVVYRKHDGIPVSDPDSFRKEIDEFLQSRNIVEKLSDLHC